MRVAELVSRPAVGIRAEQSVGEAAGLMEQAGVGYRLLRTSPVRRLAVKRGDRFIAMVSIDDLLILVAGELKDLSRPVAREVESAQRDSAVPATA